MAKKLKAQGKTLTKRVSEHMASLGIHPTNRPMETYTQMPEDPTNLPAKTLQKFYTAMVAWYAYSNEALAEVKITLLDLDRRLRREKAIRLMGSSEGTKWKAENKIAKDPVLHKLERNKMEFEGKRIALETVVENYDAKSKALSRELTRRGVEYSQAGRI